jgi:hypothetical protein
MKHTVVVYGEVGRGRRERGGSCDDVGRNGQPSASSCMANSGEGGGREEATAVPVVVVGVTTKVGRAGRRPWQARSEASSSCMAKSGEGGGREESTSTRRSRERAVGERRRLPSSTPS